MSEHAQSIIGTNSSAEGTADPQLSGKWLTVARVGWLILALVALFILVTSLPGYALRLSGQAGHVWVDNRSTSAAVFAALSVLASLASALLSLGLAAMLFRRRFEDPTAAALSFFLLLYGVVMAGPLEAWSIYWTDNLDFAITMQTLLMSLPMMAFFLLFPNGRFVPAWTRWVFLLTIPWSLSLLLPLINDAAFFTSLSMIQAGLLTLWYVSFLVIGLYAQIYRYRRISSPVERQQTKWILFGFSLWITYAIFSTGPYLYISNMPPGAPIPWWVPVSSFAWFLALSIIPISMTIAITRYHLWDIDLVINRTLLVGALTVSIIGLYVLIVGAVGMLFQTQGNWLIALAATGLVAVLFQPLRERLQRGVNQLVYGQRDEPFEVLAHLGQQLEGTLSPELVYPTIVETVAQTLKLPYAEIAVPEDAEFKTVESYGRPGGDLVIYPLTHQGEVVGQLRVARRTSNEDFTAADDRLLRSIAQQAGTAVHAVHLTTALQESRHNLVTAREEERRRLRRDLHDGLGPQLASQTLGLDAALKLMDRDPQAAKELLQALSSQNQDAVKDIRQLVYGLRPPALDELGLIEALRESTLPYEQQGLKIDFDVPQSLPDLPAAVEVAAYRIIQEGLTNVARHARAEICRVHLAVEDSLLEIEIKDDGRGLPPDNQPGVGLLSMRERAAELNGRCLVESPAGGGTRVFVQLPLN
jgi:signal transduction histidine kinase